MAVVAPSDAAADAPEDITVISSEFDDGEIITAQYTCDGRDVSPPLTWEDVPDGTAELVVTVEDPDAPDETFVHWMVAGIEPTSPGILEGGLPEGATVGLNDFGESTYKGPCPPHDHGPHRYVFTVMALREGTRLQPRFTAEKLYDQLEDNVLAKGVLIGRYGRTPRPPVKSG
ncbi:MAG: YbhB/YbcL family Raf kinase inhibitor-like protein [Actinomycetota bacterium]|nr:YbhB/YbcL family Raf kinase inhibitor-like protein [Actinomycetota bacterium]